MNLILILAAKIVSCFWILKATSFYNVHKEFAVFAIVYSICCFLSNCILWYFRNNFLLGTIVRIFFCVEKRKSKNIHFNFKPISCWTLNLLKRKRCNRYLYTSFLKATKYMFLTCLFMCVVMRAFYRICQISQIIQLINVTRCIKAKRYWG